MAAGYVYVLVNSSMPGLVKVGKTRRLPSERVEELSRATGVATPFVIAFEEACGDCDAVEAAVHAELERRGFRQVQNREFFRATSNEVIRIILAFSAQIGGKSTQEIDDVDDDRPNPWDDLLAEAQDLQSGDGEVFQDIDGAIRLYRMAARLGSPEACLSLGMIYFFGQEVRPDQREALNWFQEATKRGGIEGYIWMAKVYCKSENFDNAVKACRKYFEMLGSLDEFEREQKISGHVTEIYIHLCLEFNMPIEFPQFIGAATDKILSRVIPRLTDNISWTEREELTRVRDALLRVGATGT